jgi:mersacidin/lichenicidin family type 2 lantibiotic
MAVDIARAWKDPEYRKSLTPEELASLPPNPAGNPVLTDHDLDLVTGGMEPLATHPPECLHSWNCATSPDFGCT